MKGLYANKPCTVSLKAFHQDREFASGRGCKWERPSSLAGFLSCQSLFGRGSPSKPLCNASADCPVCKFYKKCFILASVLTVHAIDLTVASMSLLNWSVLCRHCRQNTGADLGYMTDLLQALEAAKVPAPSPIEQRWTAASLSPLSPAHSQNKDDIFSWVGIIMYLGTDDPYVRDDITAR